MKTKILVTLIILTFCISCGYLFQLKPNKKITHRIEYSFQQTKQPVDLTTLDLGIQWDKFLILQPYSQPKDIAKKLPQLDLQNIYQSDIMYSDNHFELVFIKNNKSIATCNLSRNIKISPKGQLNLFETN
ncbi:hypothetical protein [Rhizosphaericola mali]|uniref:Uncharacterized protein n=1 Tax=Rhizosphaericola mali TaxID=2545455 RepID=A0A5P2G907_9BACT|nr:hypothetical protein [Rhizosphaericola mali]QES89703.1 hypothetical protein E0W69_013875 [Rhizosphaericola mali]